jgi:hypothetical protein
MRRVVTGERRSHASKVLTGAFVPQSLAATPFRRQLERQVPLLLCRNFASGSSDICPTRQFAARRKLVAIRVGLQVHSKARRLTATTEFLAPDILNKCGRASPADGHHPRGPGRPIASDRPAARVSDAVASAIHQLASRVNLAQGADRSDRHHCKGSFTLI